jgi:hypothetical protein
VSEEANAETVRGGGRSESGSLRVSPRISQSSQIRRAPRDDTVSALSVRPETEGVEEGEANADE